MSRLLACVLLFAACAVAAEEGDRRPPFITTPNDVVERMLALAGTGPQDLVLDLGSGDGRIPIIAALKYGARGKGIELDEGLVRKSRENARAARVADRVSFVQGDVLEADISMATVVTVYLLPSLLDKLQPRFIDELAPGTRVVSHAFPMVGWKPDAAERMRIAQRHSGQGDESTLYLWVVPVDARGRWRAGELELRIQQNYQELDLVVERAGQALPGASATLKGRAIAWSSGALRFTGRVEGASMSGTLSDGNGGAPVSFARGR